MAEEDMQIATTEKNGRQFKNLNLKTRVSGGEVIQGMKPGNHVVVKKIKWPEGRKIGTYPLYSCTIEYKEEECTIVLNEQEHDAWKTIPINDNVKISLHMEDYTFEGVTKKKSVLTLERV